ncbi:MAG: hypothetical protein ACOX44_04320 [Limnochordia bacterium]|jgi:hypothetical protein
MCRLCHETYPSLPVHTGFAEGAANERNDHLVRAVWWVNQWEELAAGATDKPTRRIDDWAGLNTFSLVNIRRLWL